MTTSARLRRIRRLLLVVATGFLALSTSGCHEIICVNSANGWHHVFELVGGVYRCEQVRDEPKPVAIISYTVHLLVVDSDQRRARRTITITIFDEPGVYPLAVLDATPRTVSEGETVTFDPSRSRDPDGQIVEYAYDLDGLAGYERDL